MNQLPIAQMPDTLPRYKLAKTLRFELRPIGRSLETFQARFLPAEKAREEAYPRVKQILDEEHKRFLERALSADHFGDVQWADLALAYKLCRESRGDENAKKALETTQAKFRKRLVESFKADAEAYKNLTAATPSNLIKDWLKRNAAGEDKNAVGEFKRFASFLIGFQENRRNIYSPDAQATSAANRAINENFPKYLDAVAGINHIAKTYPDILAEAERELEPLLRDLGVERGKGLRDFIAVENYGSFLSQRGIDDFNHLVGGYTKEGDIKVRGLNEFINLYRQQHAEAKADRRLRPIKSLYKQILSDRDTRSVVPWAFESEKEVLDSVEAFFARCVDGVLLDGVEVDAIGRMGCLLDGLGDGQGIWVKGGEVEGLSRRLYGRWDWIPTLLQKDAEERFSGVKSVMKREREVRRWLDREAFELCELEGLEVATEEGGSKLGLGANLRRCFADCAQILKARRRELKGLFKAAKGADFRLRGDEDRIRLLKDALDAMMDLVHLLKPLRVGPDFKRDEAFYGEFDSLYESLSNIIPLYSRVRNFVTKKVRGEERFKLMFDKPTLAAGWDLNKETDNRCVLLRRAGLYFLGIMSGKKPIDFSRLADPNSEDAYSKMCYKLLPGPNKMLPKVFLVSELGKRNYRPSPALIKEYEAKLYTSDPDSCHRLIDFYKQSIDKHPDWSSFGFKFRQTADYASLPEFYADIERQGYKVWFESIPAKTIDALVERGELCLFQLWNKDFAPGSKGRPNLHTLYWNAAFSEENLKDVVVKLNGEAELFYRPKSVEKPFVHRRGDYLVNRRTKDGKPIPEAIHGELFRHANGEKVDLSPAAKELLDSQQAVVKKATHAIIKDARFTQDKFAFHVPLTLNFKHADSWGFSRETLKFLRKNPSVNIIGIDRGERHLLYLSLINQKGEILQQKSLNLVSHEAGGKAAPTDYHAKLDQLEKARGEARKNWTEISAIKDMKEGYLSAVVHEIAQMMVNHNAIVVLEDLNFGFKRGRFRIEKQVYQKFEQALIKKLNYLVFKDREPTQPGGVLNAFQLTEPFVSFERLGKQTGFLFYVPAGYTSKIDPTTGFVNLFCLNSLTNAAVIKEFFLAFDSIRYDPELHSFAFAFDYSNFKTSQYPARDKWTVYSAERRLGYNPKERKETEEFPTKMILDSLAARGEKVGKDYDLKQYISGVESNKANAPFFSNLRRAFALTLQMRNSSASRGEDYIESPVLNARGERFDSRTAGDSFPQDADANGAYHIALKGLLLLQRNNAAAESEKPNLAISNEDWFAFVDARARRIK